MATLFNWGKLVYASQLLHEAHHGCSLRSGRGWHAWRSFASEDKN